MEPMPAGVDPAVWYVLCTARSSGSLVTAFLRGDPTQGRPVRQVSGVPRGFALAPDGRVRVVLAIAEGSEQIVVVERIARAQISAPA